MPYRLLEERHSGGITTREWFNERGDYVEEKIQDVEPVLEANKRALSSHERANPGEHFIRAASIPAIVVLRWLNEGVNVFDENDAKEVERRLNSSEWAYLRTAPGRL